MMLLQKLKRCLCTLILLFGFGGSWVMAQEYPLYEENTLYVKFKDQSPVSAKKMQAKGEKTIQTRLLGFSDKLIERYKIAPESTPMALFDNPILDKTFLIQVNPEAKVDIEQLMQELQKNPDIEYVERVPFNRIFSNPTPKSEKDPFYGKVGDKQLNTSWHLDLINAEKAWELQTGDPDVIVAVVDNAVWGEHEDLQIPSNLQYRLSDKSNNSAPPVSKAIQDAECDLKDLRTEQCLAYSWSHGTHCAGAIAAINNNGKGIASIGSGISLMGVGCPLVSHPIAVYDAYTGVKWAAANGAKVISCSWGGSEYSKVNENVMKACYDSGVVVIAAAGNDNISTPHYPAAYQPYVISVGSVNANREKSGFSNHGVWVDIVSPGGTDEADFGIFSTTFCPNQYTRLTHGAEDFKGYYYDEMSGTSMATPVLSGVVALMLSKDSTLTTEQIRTILQNTGQDLNRNYTFNDYCKIADAYAALKFLDENSGFGPKVAFDSIQTFTRHDSVWLDWTAPNTTENILGYNIYRNGTCVAEAIKTLSFLDVNRKPGLTRYAIEPVYAQLSSIRTEVDVTVKTYYEILAFINPDSTAGRVEGVGLYEENNVFTLKAIPADNYTFDYWIDGSGEKLYSPTISRPAFSNSIFFAYFLPKSANEALNPVAHALRVSPNPASETVLIQCDEYEMNMVRICDLAGKEIFRQTMAAHELTVRIAEWPAGTYIVRINTPNGSASKKLIKR